MRGASVALLTAVLAIAGCGSSDQREDESAAERGVYHRIVKAEREEEREAAKNPLPTRASPPSRQKTTGIQDRAYQDAEELCSIFSGEELAAEYGGNPNDISSVARAFAEASYQPAVQTSAETGCLKGLRK